MGCRRPPPAASKIVNQMELTHQRRLMYRTGRAVLGSSRRPSAGLRPAGRPPAALAAADRTRRQRLPGPRTGDAGRPATEPGLLPPAAAARRWAGHRHPQQLRRPGQLLPPGPGPLRGGADRQRRGAAPGAAPRRRTTGPPGRTAVAARSRRTVRVHRQQRPLTDRRGTAAPPHCRPRHRDQCRQPAQAPPAPQRRPGAARDVRHRRLRPAAPSTWTPSPAASSTV